ncbi:MAG: NAD(P)/FAD-dependent oxidoreductase [Myxococcales bacterium]|nr:MAG: NAD(P)/FAD-dependent oxidoreductase [Myxococcales bacterium]
MPKNLPEKHAIIQNNGRFGIAAHLPAGLITPEQLRRFADFAEKYRVEAVKITSAQRLAFIGIDEADLDRAWEDLGEKPGMAIGMCVRSVKICPGKTYCPYGHQDTLTVGMEIDRRLYGKSLPHKFKIAVSGCPFQCAENAIRDFGLVGYNNGWKAAVGGNGGPAPRLSQPLTKGLSDEAAIELAERVVKAFAGSGEKSRIGKWIEKIGLDEFKRLVGVEQAS